MARFRGVILTCGLVVAMAAAPADKTSRFVDIQPKANESLDANLGRGAIGNNFSALPRGEQDFKGVKFKVEDRFILLGSPLSKEKRTDKAEGIAVDGSFARLQILQGTFYGKGKKGDPLFVADDTLIGLYRIHYEDGKSEEIPIVYGQDVRDWWIVPNSRAASFARVAWEGDNAAAKGRGHRLRIYLGTWKNPRPEAKVTRIDYEKVADTPTAPFCLALTLESD
jgi:hypothetical protein